MGGCPFKNKHIVKVIAKINEQYFNAPSEFFLKAPDEQGVTEDVIRKKENPDTETQILFWLWRIQRYFLVKYMDKTENSKTNTAVLISGFLKQFNQFSDEIKKYICQDTLALNCLVFSLLVSKNRSDWDLVITLITQYNNTSPVLPLIKWSAKFYFNEGNDSCEEVLTELISTHPKDTEFKLPDSPLSLVFKQVALCRWYSQNPMTNPVSCLTVLLPRHSQALTVLPYIIKQSPLIELFTNNLESIPSLSMRIVRSFLVQFRLPVGQTKHPLAEFNSKEFKLFVNNFLIISLDALVEFNEAEELIGLSHLLQFYDPKPFQFCRDIYPNGLLLVQKLFALELFSVSYSLYADLIIFTHGNDTKKTADARSSLYCVCARIHEWLNGSDIELKFNRVEKTFLPGFKTLKKDLNSKELPSAPFFSLAKRLGQKFKHTEDGMIRTLCENYWSLLSEYLNATQRKEVRALFEPETHKGRDTANKRPTQSRTALKSEDKPSSKPNSKSDLNIEAVISPVNGVTSLPLTEKLATNWDETAIAIIPKVGSLTFFAPEPKIQCLSRDSIPTSVMQLINQLLKELPTAKIYLTGAAPSNILDSLTPNDYDLLVVNSTLPVINQLLLQKKFKPEIRSLKHPMIFCDMGDGITLDFTVKPLSPNQTVRQLLEEDFSQRDFNINALYCRFTMDQEFPVFSFSQALVTRNAGFIESIQNPMTSLRQDPTRLFRLGKIVITNPKYVLGHELQLTLDGLNGKWMETLLSFIKMDPGNIHRVNHAIKKLFSRHSYEVINAALDKLSGLFELTELSLKEADAACLKIPNVRMDQRFLFWVLANRLKGYELGNQSELCSTHPILVLTSLERDFLQFIYDKAPGRVGDVQVYVNEILLLIEGFKIPSASAAVNKTF